MKYYLDIADDETYQVVSYEEQSDEENKIVHYQGSLAECWAWKRLNEEENKN